VATAGARRYWWIWVAVVPIALWALVRSLGLEGDTILVPLLAFTPYAAIGGLFVAGIAAALRDVVDRGYRDAGDVAGKGLEPTFPRQGWHGLGPFITIDHVLADRRLGIVEYSVEEQPGSDHRAIHAVLALP